MFTQSVGNNMGDENATATLVYSQMNNKKTEKASNSRGGIMSAYMDREKGCTSTDE